MKCLMALFLAFVSTTLNAQIENLPLCLNKVDVKKDGLKGPVKSMRITIHNFDSISGEMHVTESVCEYNIQGNIIRREDFFNKNNDGEYEIAQYDKTGMKRLRCTLYSKKDNHIISAQNYKYNKEGDLAQYSHCGPVDTTIINYEYTYLKNGEIDEYVAYLKSDSSIWTKTDLVYANDKLCNIICYGPTMPIWFAAVDGVDDIVKEEISYGNHGNIRKHTAYKYDSNSKVIEEVDYDEDNTEITTYKYNEYGDCISSCQRGKSKITNYDGYDSFGNWTQKQLSYECHLLTEVRKIEYYE